MSYATHEYYTHQPFLTEVLRTTHTRMQQYHDR